MKLEVKEKEIHITLSKRNLLTGLSKLSRESSLRTLVSYDPDKDLSLVLKFEDDETHYGDRGFGPGPIVPEDQENVAKEYTG